MKRAGQKIVEVSLKFMNVKHISITTVFLLLATTGWTAPQSPSGQQSFQTTRAAPGEDLNAVLRQLKIGINDLKHEMSNHETEIRIFENKLQSQETSFENFQQQLSDDIQSQRDYIRASTINLEGKTETINQSMMNLEDMVRGLTNDLRQMKIQSNDSVVVLGQHKQKIAELEGLLQTQSQHMQNLEVALQSMMEVWQAKESAKEMINKASEATNKPGESGRTYKVQAGDSLEKIARTQKVSVQALREINQLTNDRILVGQTLKLP